MSKSLIPEKAAMPEERRKEVDADEKLRCIAPTADLLRNINMYHEILQSHQWIIDRSEEYGSDNILVKLHCSLCGLSRMMIISDIMESAKRAEETSM